MISRNCFSLLRSIPALAWLAIPLWLSGQSSSVLTATAPPKTAARRGCALEARITVQLRNGYHVNSHAPNDDYLIPLRLRWDQAESLKAIEVVYPKPELHNYAFSSKPVSVFTGDFPILTRFQVPASAPLGPGVLLGKLRYQACNHDSCLPPRTLEVRLPYEIQ
jgi:DsbC/DsbD-like thiol-disulfide interchange protein